MFMKWLWRGGTSYWLTSTQITGMLSGEWPADVALPLKGIKASKHNNPSAVGLWCPLLTWKSKKYYVFLCACAHKRASVGVTYTGAWLRACGLTYPVCHAQSSYCLWPLWLHHVFRHYLVNGTIFEKKKKLLNLKCLFWFSLQLLFETFLILRRNKRDIGINAKSLHVKYPLYLTDVNETWIFLRDFRK